MTPINLFIGVMLSLLYLGYKFYSCSDSHLILRTEDILIMLFLCFFGSLLIHVLAIAIGTILATISVIWLLKLLCEALSHVEIRIAKDTSDK